MKKFTGFPDDSKLSATAFPATFFTELMPMVDDLAELKVIMYSLWALNQKEGIFRYLLREEYDNEVLLEGLKAAKPKAEPETTLEHALARAVARCVLLCAPVTLEDNEFEIFCINTQKGRQAIERVQAGDFIKGFNGRPIEILPERPNIFRLYEQNIGSLTARIKDTLIEAQETYHREWIEEAINLAVDNNIRKWNYIAAILKRWETEGKNDDFSRRLAKEDSKRYITGKYADFIEH